MYYGKEVVILLKDQAKEKYLELRKDENRESRYMLDSICRAKIKLLNNPQVGNPITKKLFPKLLVQQRIQNLYRLELSGYWRLLYTLSGDKDTIFVFVLLILTHKEYNKIFGYKNK
jgi:mRNA-degrading endonuclease RelE of RelBE toxin-antitoxin system